jgi:acetoin utilization protein AcuC
VSAKRPPPVFVGHDIYRQPAYGNNHPLAIPRVERVLDLCRALGWLQPEEFCPSPCASLSQLARFHTPEYIAVLRQAARAGKVDLQTRERFAIGTVENPLFPGLFERASTCVGGSIRAAELSLEGRMAFHPAGGTHHGRPDRASGFCYFNDPALAILTLLDRGIERLLYVDLDAHHADAVQDAFAADGRVWTISVHEQGRWPYTGAVSDTAGGRACNLPVPSGFHDRELRFLLDELILPLGQGVSPQVVVLVCGADALAGDPLSSMALSNIALWSAASDIVALAPAAVVLGGGGYNPWTVVRYWTGLWGTFSGREISTTLPPAAREVFAGLECELIDAEEVSPLWSATLADVTNEALVRPEIEKLGAEALRLAGAGRWLPPRWRRCRSERQEIGRWAAGGMSRPPGIS